jgi:hypothetical protein
MAQERPEYFPSVEDLREQRRQYAEPRFLRLQSLLWMAQEFCLKMAALGQEPKEFPYSSGSTSMRGYLVPVLPETENDAPGAEQLFVGVDGYFAPFEDGVVSILPVAAMLEEDVAAAYKRAMLDSLCGKTTAVAELPEQWRLPGSA